MKQKIVLPKSIPGKVEQKITNPEFLGMRVELEPGPSFSKGGRAVWADRAGWACRALSVSNVILPKQSISFPSSTLHA